MNRNTANNTLKIGSTVIISGLHSPKYLYFGKIQDIRYDADDNMPVECLILFPTLGQMAWGQLTWYGVDELDTLESYYGPANGFKLYYEISEYVRHIVTGAIGQVYNIRDIRQDVEHSYNNVPCYTIRQDGGALFYAFSFELEPVA